MEKDASTRTCCMDEGGDKPEKGDVLGWSESFSAAYANPAPGTRCNRNSGIIDIVSTLVRGGSGGARGVRKDRMRGETGGGGRGPCRRGARGRAHARDRFVGAGFPNYVKDGMTMTAKKNGVVVVDCEDQSSDSARKSGMYYKTDAKSFQKKPITKRGFNDKIAYTHKAGGNGAHEKTV